jgi:excinuclease UvrABC nuclease subunit
MSLKEALQEVDGIGEVKSQELMTVFEDYESPESDVVHEVEKALEYMDQGDYGYAEKFLRRVVE